MRIVKAVNRPNQKGVITSHKEIVKNVGPVRLFDDGKPDLEKRLKEQFKQKTLVIDGFEYDKSEESESDTVLRFKPGEYPTLQPKNIGWFFLDPIFEQLGIGDVLRKCKSDSGIEYDLVNFVKVFVYLQILNPKSKRETMLYLQSHPMFDMTSSFGDKNIWYRCLPVLDAQFSRIQKRMDTKISQSSNGRKKTVTYYDVTNLYFEIQSEDPPVALMNENGEILCDELGEPIVIDPGFRHNGKSKEERHFPLVQISLALDENGLPMALNVYKGNTNDSTTFKDYLDKYSPDNSDKKESPSEEKEDCIYVADNGMYSQYNFYRIVSKGNGYIIRKSVKKCWKSIRSWVLDNQGWNTGYSEIQLTEQMNEKERASAKPEADTTTKDAKKKKAKKTKPEKEAEEAYDKEQQKKPSVSFKYKSRIISTTARKEKDSDEKITYDVRQIVYWSESIYEKDKHEGDKLRKELESVKKNPELLKEKNSRLRKFLKEEVVDTESGEILKDTKTIITILEAALAECEEQYGYLMLETTQTNSHELITLGKYRGLSRIEASFGICKSDLDVRPVYVSLEEQIRAHLLICYMALTITRLIQVKILKHKQAETGMSAKWTFGMSAEALQQALLDYDVCLLKEPYYIMNTISDDQRLLNETFGVQKISVPTYSGILDMKHQLKKQKL